MTTSRSTAIAVLLCALGAAGQARAEDGMTVACTLNGRIVHLERLPPGGNKAREQEIIQQNASAMCVFLAAQPASGMPLLPETVNAPPGTATPAGGLDAALRALRGEKLGFASPGSPAPGPAPDPTASAPKPPQWALEKKPQDPSAMRPVSPDWIRLAVYTGAKREDAIADWRRIVLAEPVFASLLPSITESSDGPMMLSAGPVPRASMDAVCVAAAGLGLDCLPGPGEPSRPSGASLDGARFLQATFPGLLPEPETPDMSPRRERIALGLEPVADGRLAGTTCWRSPWSAPKTFPDYPFAPAADPAVTGTPAKPARVAAGPQVTGR